jgi:glutamate dehydrogenase/leucine dehydrogenase
MMVDCLDDVWAAAKELGTSLRTAAFVLAIRRVVGTMMLKSDYRKETYQS